jgi:hypothetical protein
MTTSAYSPAALTDRARHTRSPQYHAIVRHLPKFALADPYVTRNVTIADMFGHTSGLPDHAGDLL